jgi:hypothetical protein
MHILLAVVVILTTVTSLYGWGKLIRRTGGSNQGSFSVTIVLGLSAVLALGGLLNLARIAYAPALWVIYAAGLFLSLAQAGTLRSSVSKLRLIGPIAWLEFLLVLSLILGAVLFAIATQLPPQAFNFHDDFEMYFAHPVRMLATGTIFGSPLNAVGLVTFGGQAFLHGFVLSLFPIEFINGVDAVFGLLLLMLLGASAGWGRLVPLPGAMVAPLLVIFIAPQYVNISAPFLGAALMSGAILLAIESRERKPAVDFAMALIYAGLMAIKPTYALFVVLHIMFSAISQAGVEASFSCAMKSLLRVGMFTLALTTPWMLLHVPHFIVAAVGEAASHTSAISGGTPESIDPLSTERLFYGGSMVAYSMLITLGLLSGAWALLSLFCRTSTDDSRHQAAGVASAALLIIIAWAIMLFFMGPILYGYEASLRYFVPFLLGVVPLVVVLAISLPNPLPKLISTGLPLFGVLVIMMSFTPSLIQRVTQATKHGSILAFSELASKPVYIAYSQKALSDEASAHVAQLQNLIPPLEPVIAWISQPFHLDYRRNLIIDIVPAGLATPWAKIPSDVRYLIWEYRGYAVRSPQNYERIRQSPGRLERNAAIAAIAFAGGLGRAAGKAELLHDTGSIAVFRLPAELHINGMR